MLDDHINFEVEPKIKFSNVYQMPSWVTEWASNRRLPSLISKWPQGYRSELKQQWQDVYGKLPKYYPWDLALKPLQNDTQDLPNEIWYFDQQYYLQGINNQGARPLRLAAALGAKNGGIPQDKEDPLTLQDVGEFAAAFGLTLAYGAIVTVAIAGVGAISVPVAITATGVIVVYGIGNAAYERIKNSQSTFQIVAGTASDIVGATDIWAGIADKDLITGAELKLDRHERNRRTGRGFANVALIFGSRPLKDIGSKGGKLLKPSVDKISAAIAAKTIVLFDNLLSTSQDFIAVADKSGRLVIAAVSEFLREYHNRNSTTFYSLLGFFEPAAESIQVVYRKYLDTGLLTDDDVSGIVTVNGKVIYSETNIHRITNKLRNLFDKVISESELLERLNDRQIDLAASILKKPPRGGDSPAARVGQEVHRDEFKNMEGMGIFNMINKPMMDMSGNLIMIVDGKVSVSPSGVKVVGALYPDGVIFSADTILDIKPLGTSIYKSQMVKYIIAYKEKTGHLPKRIALSRYDPITRRLLRTDLKTPADYGFK